jgi:H+/Cl- antiporter ClcA
MMSAIEKIKRLLKNIFDKINNEQLKTNILQALPFWVASLITGFAAVTYAKLFDLAEKANSRIFTLNHWLLFLITPACFVFAWWIVKRFAPFSRGSGIPQVMASIELATPKDQHKIDRLLNLKNILMKVISSLVMVFGGGAIGREGPTIQIAGSIFRYINKILPAWWPKISKRNMVMTGAAAGLAAAFNTPLGGIVFAVEELTRTHINNFKTAIFTSVIIAGLTAQAILGPYLYLGYPDVSHLTGSIFFWVAIVAIVTGILGGLLSKFILQIFRWKAKFRFSHHHLIYVLGCAIIIAGLAIFVNHNVMGSGKEMMTTALFTDEKYISWETPLLRIIGPLLSFTTGAAGGIFAPALSAGASVGSLMAGWIDLSAQNSNMLVLAGMVGFLTGVTRTPFTSAILVLEMTDRHNVIFHLMMAGMLASLSALIIDRKSFYDHLKLQYLNEIDREEEKENNGKENAVRQL